MWGSRFSILAKQMVSNAVETYLPAHPILALFSFITAIFILFGIGTTFVLGVWFALTQLMPPVLAIWALFGILLLIFIILIIMGCLALKPKKFKAPKPIQTSSFHQEDSIESVVSAFINGFISK
jgi:hypothetical protein